MMTDVAGCESYADDKKSAVYTCHQLVLHNNNDNGTKIQDLSRCAFDATRLSATLHSDAAALGRLSYTSHFRLG